MSLTLFLKRLGIVYVSAPGAAGGKVRFGGATEPLVWGAFALYRTRDEAGKLYLKSVDVADDMLLLRSRPEALFTVARWFKLLLRHLMEAHADDGLLANLYWNMRLLCGGLPVKAAEWRFIWRWLKSWGLAPDISKCASGTASEVELLRFVSTAKASRLESFEPKESLESCRRFFADASRRAEEYLTEI